MIIKRQRLNWLKFTNVIHHQYELDYLSFRRLNCLEMSLLRLKL